mgnify:CR=1 FL=1
MQSVTAYIGLGSNLDDPAAQVAAAIDALANLPESSLRTVSSLYRNPPMGPQDQPDYVNAVVALDTRLAPRVLLDAMEAKAIPSEPLGPLMLHDLQGVLEGSPPPDASARAQSG